MAFKVFISREIIAVRCTMEYPSNRLTLFPFNGRKIIAKNNCREKKTIFYAGRKNLTAEELMFDCERSRAVEVIRNFFLDYDCSIIMQSP